MVSTNRANLVLIYSRTSEDQKLKDEPIHQLKKHIGQQVAKYAKRINAYKATPNPQHAVLEQHRYNYEQAMAVRDRVLEKAEQQIAQGKPIHVDPDANVGLLINPRYLTQYLLNEERQV